MKKVNIILLFFCLMFSSSCGLFYNIHIRHKNRFYYSKNKNYPIVEKRLRSGKIETIKDTMMIVTADFIRSTLKSDITPWNLKPYKKLFIIDDEFYKNDISELNMKLDTNYYLLWFMVLSSLGGGDIFDPQMYIKYPSEDYTYYGNPYCEIACLKAYMELKVIKIGKKIIAKTRLHPASKGCDFSKKRPLVYIGFTKKYAIIEIDKIEFIKINN